MHACVCAGGVMFTLPPFLPPTHVLVADADVDFLPDLLGYGRAEVDDGEQCEEIHEEGDRHLGEVQPVLEEAAQAPWERHHDWG